VFYILNDAPVIDAPTAKAAAKQYAQANGIEAGTVLVGEPKAFEISVVPQSVDATPK
jgi:hypothetical protein